MWEVKYLKEANLELQGLDGSIKKQVLKGIQKVSTNPLPKSEGGYGNPLGHKNGNNLTGYFKIKYLNIGIRVVYTIDRENKIMTIIVVAARSDNECYDIAEQRKK